MCLFPNIKDDNIYCYKNAEYEKPDLCIKVGKKVKYISIKMGHKNSVHCESIEKFKKFLKSMNINQTVIYQILKYQYTDGTIDGSGQNRHSSNEYKLQNEASINLINKELNQSKIIKKVINRFLI